MSEKEHVPPTPTEYRCKTCFATYFDWVYVGNAYMPYFHACAPNNDGTERKEARNENKNFATNKIMKEGKGKEKVVR